MQLLGGPFHTVRAYSKGCLARLFVVSEFDFVYVVNTYSNTENEIYDVIVPCVQELFPKSKVVVDVNLERFFDLRQEIIEDAIIDVYMQDEASGHQLPADVLEAIEERAIPKWCSFSHDFYRQLASV